MAPREFLPSATEAGGGDQGGQPRQTVGVHHLAQRVHGGSRPGDDATSPQNTITRALVTSYAIKGS